MSRLSGKLTARLEAHALHVGDTERDKVLVYLELLARWNRKINLTAFDLASPTDEAIDRLVIEPFAACVLVWADDRNGVDVGSGGGSPALPLAIRCPGLRMTLVESRQRKASFLREAIRVLELRAEVAVCRIEDAVHAGVPAAGADVVTIRAVRLADAAGAAVLTVLKDGGRVLHFGHITDCIGISFRPALEIAGGHVCVGSLRARIEVREARTSEELE